MLASQVGFFGPRSDYIDRNQSADKLRVLLIDDCRLHRTAIRTVIAETTGAHVIESEDFAEAIAHFRREALDIVLLSLALANSNSLVLMRALLELNPFVKILVFSERPRVVYANRALSSGAVGYISKSVCSDELVKALRTIAKGKIYLDPEIATKLALRRVLGETNMFDGLTVREQEILRLVGEGRTLTSIAENFGVAYKTVANSCTRIKRKLDVTSTTELMKIACEMRDD